MSVLPNENSQAGSSHANGHDKDFGPPHVHGERPNPERERRNARSSRMASRFANVVGVLMRDPNFRNLRLADLEWLVIPPLMVGQCRVAHSTMPAPVAPAKGNELLVPVAVALWASVSE